MMTVSDMSFPIKKIKLTHKHLTPKIIHPNLILDNTRKIWFYITFSLFGSRPSRRLLSKTMGCEYLTWNRSSVSFSPICLRRSPLACPMLPAAVKTVCRGYEQRTHIGWKENALPARYRQSGSAGREPAGWAVLHLNESPAICQPGDITAWPNLCEEVPEASQTGGWVRNVQRRSLVQLVGR